MDSYLPPNPDVQKERLNVEIVPGTSVDTAFSPPIFRTLRGGVRLDAAFSRIQGWCGNTHFEEPSKAEDKLLREVIEWFDLNESDNNWMVRRSRWKSLLPPTNERLTALTSRLSNYTQDESDCPDSLLYLIAVQLLASCYTLSIPQSACSLPLELHTGAPEFITALRLLGQYRFSPAAGHHARESSVESYWPGLCIGPSLEDQIAEQVSRQRLRANCGSEGRQYTCIDEPFYRTIHAGEWSDGPGITEAGHAIHTYDSSPSSSTTPESRCFPLFRVRQPSVFRIVKHPHYDLHQHTPRNQQLNSEPPVTKRTFKGLASIFQPKTYHSMVKMPSIPRLRRTQSVPRRSSDGIAAPPPVQSRRHSTSASILVSPSVSPREIPVIRRWSATGTDETEDDGRGYIRHYAPDYFDEIFSSESATLSPGTENVWVPANRPNMVRGEADFTVQRLGDMERVTHERRISLKGSVYASEEGGKGKGYDRIEDHEVLETWSEDSIKRRIGRMGDHPRASLSIMSDSDDSAIIWDKRRHGIAGDIGWFEQSTPPGPTPDDNPVPILE